MAATSAVVFPGSRVVSVAALNYRRFACEVSTIGRKLSLSLANTGAFRRLSQRSGPVKCTLETKKKVSSETNKVVGGGDGWIAENDGLVRSLALFLGSGALMAVLLNRILSGIAPVADASSAQSRSDVLALALAATVLLQGLVWKSIQPRAVVSVEMEGVKCFTMAPRLPSDAARELHWVWDAVRSATRTKALVVLYGGACVLQAGLASTSADGNAVPVNATEFSRGTLYKDVQKSGRQNYLANLALYPGRFELSFLPSNAQAVLLQPLGDDGILIVACDAIRGFTAKDQGWISTIAEKLDTTLQQWAPSDVVVESSASQSEPF